MSAQCFCNRELSWLAFNRRVLENAANPQVPLCERLNFLSIFQSNLDEFFMVRIGTLHDQMMLNNDVRDNKTGLTPSTQISEALNLIRELCRKRDKVYVDLLKELNREGIFLARFDAISNDAEHKLKKMFRAEILPYLSRYYISRKQDFPFLNNKEIYSIAILNEKNQDGSRMIAVIPGNSSVLPRLIPVPGSPGHYILVEEFILHFLPLVVPGNKILQKTIVRVTRNADIDADAVYDEDLDYREHMAMVINRRKRLSPVRLELTRQIETGVMDMLRKQLSVSAAQVFEYDTPLDLSFLYQFSDTLRAKKQLFYVPYHSRKMIPSGNGIMELALQGDILLHYPYDSFKTFLRLLHEAAYDPAVTDIRMTLYRVARDSKVAETLAEAAENGKNVEVFVELKARFDEENNIEWSRRLEQSGCQVIYGIEHIKVHSKICLITRRDAEGNDSYLTQIGTGNYNEKTSKIYTDFSLITADQAIGRDGMSIFAALKEGRVIRQSEKLLVSPKLLLPALIDMIDEEIKQGDEGLIRIKINSLTDRELMDKLIEASQAGVHIEMVVRGICCLIAGVPGYTDNISIISIVGRFLEHSRMYLFGKGKRLKAFISSADWMTRNMDRRVEIAAPITNPEHIQTLEVIFAAYRRDNCQSWHMANNGEYIRNENGRQPAFNAQESFIPDDSFVTG